MAKTSTKQSTKPAKKVESSASESDSSSAASSSASEASDSESEEEKKAESSSESESESESEAEEKTTSNKRKAEESVSEEASSTSEEEPAAKKQKAEEVEEPVTLFVGRLSWNIDDEWLKREFEPIGGVISARVMMERATGKSRGYGYVDFENKAAADKALSEMQGKEIDGRPINLDLSTGKPKSANAPGDDRAKKFGDSRSAPSDTLFVGNLSFNAERNNLMEAFSAYGTVMTCRIPTHPDTQQPKGFGYVQFASVDEATAALEGLNGQYIEGRACRLDFSTPRDNNNGGRGGRGGARGGRGGRGGFGGRERSATPTSGYQGNRKTFD